MVSVHLARAVGGEVFFGVMAAVAFATILAVVAGLTIASVSAISHDLYNKVFSDGNASEEKQIQVSRFAAVAIGIIVSLLGILFEKQSIAYLVSLTLAIGAATNFPLLILSMYWQGLTTRGAIVGGVVGLLSAIVLMILGPVVWVGVLGYSKPIFPEAYPALYAVTAAFLTMYIVSVLDQSAQSIEDRQSFYKLSAAS